MAFVHGRNTEIWLGGFDLSVYCNDLAFSADVDTAETSTFGSSWKTHLPGMAGAKVDVKGYFDPAGVPLLTDVIQAEAILTAGPAGMAAIGDLARLINVDEAAYAESSPVGGVVAFSTSFLADGEVGFGKVAHELKEEAIDGSSAYIDLGTAADGAVAHLHVTAVSAGESIVVSLSDATTSGGAYTTVTGGTFASKAAAGSERLAIPGTLRRYVKANWDITDNGGTVAITFAVAVARLP